MAKKPTRNKVSGGSTKSKTIDFVNEKGSAFPRSKKSKAFSEPVKKKVVKKVPKKKVTKNKVTKSKKVCKYC